MEKNKRFIGHSEGKCIPFDGVRYFAKLYGLRETIDKSRETFDRVGRKVYPKEYVEKFSPYRKLLHQLAYSGAFITAFALYEYLRTQYPLPDLKPVMPAASFSVADTEGVHLFGRHTTVQLSTDGKSDEVTAVRYTRTGGPLGLVKSGFEVETIGDDEVQE